MIRKIVIAAGVLITLISAIAIFSYPAAAACAIAQTSTPFPNQQALLDQARTRIQQQFGETISKPVVYFFDSASPHWPLRLNEYGSTSFLGYKTCVAIGPQGQNIDVVAHELMHAEIEARVGFWKRTTILPVWFDEGLAMQVDYRERYTLPPNAEYSFVTRLESGRQFFSSDRASLIRHYSAAKSAVHNWLLRTPERDAYGQLQKLKQGQSFDSIWTLQEN